MKVFTKNNKAVVRCQYQEKELIKAIGDYKFNKVSATWIFPLHKLIEIIDNLHIEYSDETYAVYERLREKRKVLHAKINLANEIKTGSKPFFSAIKDVNLSQCYEHQKQAISIGTLFDSYAFFMETGTGKTLVAIKLMEYWKVPAMVVAPLSTIESVWKREFKKWSTLNVVNLRNNIGAIEDVHDVYLINYEQFKKLHKDKRYDIPESVQAIVIDESSKLKNPSSQITKTFLKYKDLIKHRLCLTGTPAPNNIMEYWGQMCFINSELLSENYYKFRNTYFFSTGYGGYLYKPFKGATEAIINNVAKQAFSVRKEDCLDLPERVYEERSVQMDPVQETLYNNMLRENIIEFEGHTTIGVNEIAKMMKLRQVTAGFTITTEHLPVIISESKIKVLKELIEEIPEEKNIIIWCQFHWEIEALKRILGEKATTLFGGMTQKEKDKSINDFLEGKYRYFIGHPKSGGMGLNFQSVCNYMVWFSLSYSQEEYSQACDRIYRSGQKNKCTYFILQAKKADGKKSIDEIIYKVLQKKSTIMNACMEMLKG